MAMANTRLPVKEQEKAMAHKTENLLTPYAIMIAAKGNATKNNRSPSYRGAFGIIVKSIGMRNIKKNNFMIADDCLNIEHEPRMKKGRSTAGRLRQKMTTA